MGDLAQGSVHTNPPISPPLTLVEIGMSINIETEVATILLF